MASESETAASAVVRNSEAEKFKAEGNEYFKGNVRWLKLVVSNHKTNPLHSEHKFEEAITAYTQAIQFDENNSVYWSNRAFCHLKMENYGAAEIDATKAIEIDPRYTKVPPFPPSHSLGCVHMRRPPSRATIAGERRCLR